MTFLFILLTSLFADGNQAYSDGQYAQAVDLYQQCLSGSDNDSLLSREGRAQVYYNLGNAYFKQGELSQAILSYERSLRLNPSDEDAQFNLEFARTQITDDIPDNQAFFFTTWAKHLRNSLSQPTWLWLSIGAFIVTLVGALLFALGRTIVVRQVAFHVGWLTLVLSIFTGLNAYSLHQRDSNQSEAIITQGTLNAKSSPDESGTDLFTLHEGTKVEIKETLGKWCNIHVGNNEGWILQSYLERI